MEILLLISLLAILYIAVQIRYGVMPAARLIRRIYPKKLKGDLFQAEVLLYVPSGMGEGTSWSKDSFGWSESFNASKHGLISHIEINALVKLDCANQHGMEGFAYTEVNIYGYEYFKGMDFSPYGDVCSIRSVGGCVYVALKCSPKTYEFIRSGLMEGRPITIRINGYGEFSDIKTEKFSAFVRSLEVEISNVNSIDRPRYFIKDFLSCIKGANDIERQRLGSFERVLKMEFSDSDE